MKADGPIQFLFALAGALGLWLAAGQRISAATPLLNNDFSQSTVGSYSGPNGDPLGTAPELGNVTGLRSDIQVTATGGVGDSPVLYHAQDVTLRSRGTHDVATSPAVSFSVYFQFDPTTAIQGGGFVGMGWALGAATDGVSPYSSGSADRILIGLRRPSSGQNTVYVTSGGRFGEFGFSGDLPTTHFNQPSATLANSGWYQLSFALAFNYNSADPAASTWTLSNLALRDWGADGQTGGTVLLQQTSDYTWNPGFGDNLNLSHSAYAYVAGNGDRGVQRLDNVLVEAVPEPSAVGWTLLAASATAGIVLRRRTPRAGKTR